MRRFLPCVLLCAALLAPGCVQFKQATLYDGVAPVPVLEKPDKLSLAVEPEIYRDDSSVLWFSDNPDCIQGRVTSEMTYEGEEAVAVSWNRGAAGCEWAGLGFGWDNWAGKDLSQILPFAAITMRIRTEKGKMYGLPIVLTLEDYAGGKGFAYTGNRYFERPFIDEEWQQVTVPLTHFDTTIENLDLTNVKQLMFELQQSGSIFLDEIQLIFYEEVPEEPWFVEAPRPDPRVLPITLFGDAFINDNGWGLGSDKCQTFAPTTTNPAAGSTALHLRWDLSPEDCFFAGLGVSWDKWHPIDLTPIRSTMAIQFDIRLASGTATTLPINVGLLDYNRVRSTVRLEGNFNTRWQTVTIPVRDLDGLADLTNTREVIFLMQEAGEIYLDNLRLVSVN